MAATGAAFTVCGEYAIITKSDIAVLRGVFLTDGARYLLAYLTHLDGSDARFTAHTARHDVSVASVARDPSDDSSGTVAFTARRRGVNTCGRRGKGDGGYQG